MKIFLHADGSPLLIDGTRVVNGDFEVAISPDGEIATYADNPNVARFYCDVPAETADKDYNEIFDWLLSNFRDRAREKEALIAAALDVREELVEICAEFTRDIMRRDGITCSHEWVDAGFAIPKIVCRKCNTMCLAGQTRIVVPKYKYLDK